MDLLYAQNIKLCLTLSACFEISRSTDINIFVHINKDCAVLHFHRLQLRLGRATARPGPVGTRIDPLVHDGNHPAQAGRSTGVLNVTDCLGNGRMAHLYAMQAVPSSLTP